MNIAYPNFEQLTLDSLNMDDWEKLFKGEMMEEELEEFIKVVKEMNEEK